MVKAETPEEKYNRLQALIQKIVLTEYPNPERMNCPGSAVIAAYSKRVMDAADIVENDGSYKHITHCSTCYAEFLKANDEVRAQRHSSQVKPISRRIQKRMEREVDQLEQVMKAIALGR